MRNECHHHEHMARITTDAITLDYAATLPLIDAPLIDFDIAIHFLPPLLIIFRHAHYMPADFFAAYAFDA